MTRYRMTNPFGQVRSGQVTGMSIGGHGIGHGHRVYEGFCEDLARQNTVARLSQLQLGFRRCRIWVSAIIVVVS
jgi:hypothetical protein